MKKSALYLTTAAATAALYVLLTWLGNAVGIPAIGPVEFRFSEGLTILPVFTSAAIPGLTVGCLVANLILGGSIWDIIFGSLATLIGAFGTYLLRRSKWLPYLPPIAANTLIVTPILIWVYGFKPADQSVPVFYLIFLAGEAASVIVFGILIRKALEKSKVFK